MNRAFGVIVCLGLHAGCCTPIDRCDVDSDCPAEEPRCDVDNGICVAACDADNDCSEIQRCNIDKGFCVPGETE